MVKWLDDGLINIPTYESYVHTLEWYLKKYMTFPMIDTKLLVF